MARYIGGPCDGQEIIDVSAATRTCGGVTYVRSGLDYYVQGNAPGDPGGTLALGTHAPRGWGDLQRAVNRALPTGAARAGKLNRASRRKLRRRKRLG